MAVVYLDSEVKESLMITRNEVKMVGFAIVGIAFILAGLFAKTMNVGGSRPSTVKWYHRLIAIWGTVESSGSLAAPA